MCVSLDVAAGGGDELSAASRDTDIDVRVAVGDPVGDAGDVTVAGTSGEAGVATMSAVEVPPEPSGAGLVVAVTDAESVTLCPGATVPGSLSRWSVTHPPPLLGTKWMPRCTGVLPIGCHVSVPVFVTVTSHVCVGRHPTLWAH